MKKFLFYIHLLAFAIGFSQNEHRINASLDVSKRLLNIQHELTFTNSTNRPLDTLYLNDWANAYTDKNTPLSKRFSEEYNRTLHLAKKRDRGHTEIITVMDSQFSNLDWSRLKDQSDILKLKLNNTLYPGQKVTLRLVYRIKIPNSKFTRYGFTKSNNFNLRYWYLTPAINNKGFWTLYSNKDLDDLYIDKAKYEIDFSYPENYQLITELEKEEVDNNNGSNRIILKGADRNDIKLLFYKTNDFVEYETDKYTLVTNIKDDKLPEVTQALVIDRMAYFLAENLGAYPHKKILVTQAEYKKNPVYGLNQLPSFIRPFPDEFQFDITLLKTLINNYLENTILLDPRSEKWMTDAIQTYLMMKYVEQYYPDMKLAGNLAKVWGVRSYNFAKMDFNDQYPFLYMLMARKNLDQALTTPKDSLVRFNEKIANKYKAGVGLKYLDAYLNDHTIEETIKEFYNSFLLKDPDTDDFEAILQKNAKKDVTWFFNEYLDTRKQIDYKIKKVKKSGDSLKVTIKNKTGTNMPISLFGLKNDSIVSKNWYLGIKDKKTFTIPKQDINKLVLNYDKVIPEFNQRDNWKSLKGFFFNNRPFQFRFFKDTEDPHYNQIFYVPILTFNIYDGLTPALRFYNKSFLNKPFIYDIRPGYATKEKALVGSARVSFTSNINDGSLYLAQYGLRGATFHYAPDLRYTTITPWVSFGFRPNDFRSNEKQFFTLRHVNVIRDQDPSVDSDPDYSVFNARYTYANPGAIRFFSFFTDLQVANNFSKLSFNLEYRKLFQNNRQLNLRLFAGKFIYNETNSDFFSYALDRPTDYLFDYDYLGRSEDSGIFSQQLIVAEGGFKSRLPYPFADDWILTGNASYSIWRWIEGYGDVGFIKSVGDQPRFVYDSGIRLNLVEDYFELYFPVYSNNGWELSQPNYQEKIRFIVTLSPRTLINLFTRKWF